MMIRLNHTFAILLLVALLLSACQPITAPAAAVPQPPHGLRPDAPSYAVRGPYAVGVRDFTIEGTAEYSRSITLSVWYPALNPTNAPQEITYEMDITAGEYPPTPVHGHALQDANPDMSAGPYPLVIFSHAAWSFRQSNIYLLEQLASRGFAVIAPDHVDNWGTLFQPTHIAEIYRPIELHRTLDYAEALTANGGALAGLIDMERVAAAGFSFGGEEALILGGAKFNLDEFFAYCKAEDNPIGDCEYAEVINEMATTANLEAPPTGLWPDWSDPRVDAVVALAPAAHLFGKTGTQEVDVPVLFMEVTNDEMVGPGLAYFSAYAQLPSARKSRVTFEGANHLLFFNSCAANPGLVEQGFFWICADPVWDMDRAHDLVDHFVTAFLLAELKGDADAAAALAPENVLFTGIQYETIAFATPSTTATVAPLPKVAEIEALIQQAMAENQIPGMALGIVNGGEIAYTHAFGVERVGTVTPVTLHSIFGTGSIGKTATATAIMQLVEQGKIDLDAPVTDYLPYFKLADERYQAITVRHLITHRSGLPEVADWFPEPVEYDDGALERYVRTLSSVELLFAPGEQWSYSGNGFIVLADVVAKVSGQTFEEYLRDQIVDPLGMRDTLLIVQEADQPLMVGNHVRNEQGEVVVSDIFPYRRQFTPTGPLNSSITDMTRYAAAHLGRGELEGTRILAAETYDRMWEKISDLDFDFGEVITPLFANYGMGWTLGEIDGHRIAAHFGIDEGFSAAMLLAPDDDVAVVLISNYFDQEEFNLAVWETAIQTMRMMLEPGE